LAGFNRGYFAPLGLSNLSKLVKEQIQLRPIIALDKIWLCHQAVTSWYSKYICL
jgi:hypothetical protein